MKAILLFATIACVSVLGKKHSDFTPAKTFEAVPVKADTTIEPSFIFYSAAAKGFIDGYYRGMYKRTNYTVNDTCLGQKSLEDMEAIYNVISNTYVLISF